VSEKRDRIVCPESSTTLLTTSSCLLLRHATPHMIELLPLLSLL